MHPDFMVSVVQGYCGNPFCGSENIANWKTKVQIPIMTSHYYSVDFWNMGLPSDDPVPFNTSLAVSSFYQDLYSKGAAGATGGVQSDMGLSGLGYYLYSFAMWDFDEQNIEGLRQDFLDKSFGAETSDGCVTVRGCMKKYYDTISPDNAAINTNATWGKAVDFLSKAGDFAASGDQIILQRINDIKYWWYYVYLNKKITLSPADQDMVNARDLMFKQGKSYSVSWSVFNFFFDKKKLSDGSILWTRTTTPMLWRGLDSDNKQICPIH